MAEATTPRDVTTVTAQEAEQVERANEAAVTEIVEIKDRGHALVIDSGWRDVADTALAFVERFT